MYVVFILIFKNKLLYPLYNVTLFGLSIVSGCFHIDALKIYKIIYDTGRLQIVFDLKEIYLLLVYVNFYVNFVASDFFFQIMTNVEHMIKLRMIKIYCKNRD